LRGAHSNISHEATTSPGNRSREATRGAVCLAVPWLGRQLKAAMTDLGSQAIAYRRTKSERIWTVRLHEIVKRPCNTSSLVGTIPRRVEAHGDRAVTSLAE
jgi:hypothetical protein